MSLGFVDGMLTLFVYSRPGRLPDCQLVLGGMLVPCDPRGPPLRRAPVPTTDIAVAGRMLIICDANPPLVALLP
jgi:hypothetical protein